MSVVMVWVLVSVGLVAQVNTEQLRGGGKAEGLTQSIMTDLDIIQGNTDQRNLSLWYRADLKATDYSGFLETRFQNKESSGKQVMNKGFGHLRVIYPWQPSLEWEGFVQKEYNDAALLVDRQLVGGGVRFPLTMRRAHGSQTMVMVGVGGMMEWEQLGEDRYRQGGTFKSTNYVTVEQELVWGIMYKSTSYLQLDISNVGDYRVLSSHKVTIPVRPGLKFELAFDLQHDNKPPPGVIKRDWGLHKGISFQY